MGVKMRKICSRCIYDTHIPGISFDSEGICNYCRIHGKMERDYPTSGRELDEIVDAIKRSGKGKRYDCVIGVSGGCDSSYLMWKLKEKGLRMLAVHWDNNWNTKTAEENMRKMVKKLNVDFIRIGIDREEYDDLCKSFLKASTPDADIPNDIAITTVLYEMAEAFNVKYIINGHSFRTEGFTPLGWTYMDGKYIESVHNKFGSVPLKRFPNLLMDKWLKWLTKDKIKRVRPLYYIDYQKQKAKEELNERFGWEWYGGHHAENRYTKFVSNYLWPKKFGIDLRYVEYSALVRSGQMTREEALEKIKKPPTIEKEIIEEVKRRLGLTDEEFEDIMKQPVKTYRDYETYHPYFKKNKAMFKDMLDKGLIPETFYVKYTR